MAEATHLAVLRHILTSLQGAQVNWALTGSLAFALQGLPVEVHDIDIQTDKAGAYEIERCLKEFVTRPVTLSAAEYIRSHFGALRIDGIEVEIMGDVQKRLPDGAWEAPVDLDRPRRFVPLGEMRVPVLDLAYEADAYRKMGRAEGPRCWCSG